jgi:hypothetical protein
VPRNVVTLVPRRGLFGRGARKEAQHAIVARLGERFRPRVIDEGRRVELDFPKQTPRREAKERVAAELDKIDPRWRRLFALYPNEGSLRRRES